MDFREPIEYRGPMEFFEALLEENGFFFG